jgi:type IV pilus assembly protein PilA
MMSQLKKRLKEQRGLTLVELLAVIVILGIISAIAVPSIGGLINKTKDDAEVAEAIQIINAAKLYVASEDPGDKTLKYSDLQNYLENVNDDDFEVEVDQDETTGKYSYKIKNHNAVTIVKGSDDNEATEEDLHKY